MTTYYYHTDSGSVDSTASINKARKQTIGYMEKYPRNKETSVPIYTNLYRSTVYGYVVKGIRTYDGYVFCDKTGMNVHILKKDGTLGHKL